MYAYGRPYLFDERLHTVFPPGCTRTDATGRPLPGTSPEQAYEYLLYTYPDTPDTAAQQAYEELTPYC